MIVTKKGLCPPYHRINQISCLILFTIIGGLLIASAHADNTSEAERAQLSVVNVSLTPDTFEPFDTGTLTCVIKNNGQASVPVDRVTVYDKDIILTSREFDTTAWISPGESRTLSFTIKAECGDGTYYPILSVNTRDGGSIRYPVRLKVDSREPVVSIDTKPDTFTAGKKETIGISVSNPRENQIKNVHLIPSGDQTDTSPTDIFIGSLQSGESRKLSFEVTPDIQTNLTFALQYSNGENDHETSRAIQVYFGKDKKQADPYVSNVIVKMEKEVYHITGDVTNAGMENAVSVVVTTTGNATPTYPYKDYVVGTLKPDDFSSFELTFTAGKAESIPIEIRFKDEDGNQYSKTTDLELKNTQKGDDKSGSSPVFIVLVIVLCLGAGGLFIFRKRILPGVFR